MRKEYRQSVLQEWNTASSLPAFSTGYTGTYPVPVAARSTAWICGRSLAGIEGSNLAGVMSVSLLLVLCVVR